MAATRLNLGCMAVFSGRVRRGRVGRGWCARCCAVAFCLCALPGAFAERVQEGTVPSKAESARAWQRAESARQAFEEEPVGQHTRAEYAEVMNGFRAIYHGNPGDLYAPRAVDAVAELLAEQGRELKDRKSLRDAAGQYEFLAKAYPQSSLAAPGLAKALQLLGPEQANDASEAAQVRTTLKEKYPRSAAERMEADAGIVVARPASGETEKSVRSEARAGDEERRSPAETTHKALVTRTADDESAVDRTEALRGKAVVNAVDDQAYRPGAAPAVVSGIRHWSTSSYTRVAIDLGAEVQFKAARVEHPDRIFFDLHGAKLAPGLLGKSFAVTDDGFLKTIRAGQSSPDVTRIVLDVQPVAEYSAFLLPNPYRLIIDIHGKQTGETAGVQTAESAPERKAAEAGAKGSDAAASEAAENVPAPVERAGAAASANVAGVYSTLPPMPVTDGSGSFGLPAKRDQSVVRNQAVAQPRVVVPAKPTSAKPVPNSVTTSVPEGNREVAAVSEGPGVIEATEKPTSKPVVDRTASRGRGAEHKTRGVQPEIAERTAAAAGVPTVPPPPTAEGQSTLMRALGLKIGRIVIDAGHGGHDSGTLGPDGIEEKDVVLDVALRLGKLLHDRLGAEIVYTRADDTFIPLETRTAIANKAQADLFISVHANSSQDSSARGVEVYYLNFTSDPEAMQVASRENAVSSQRVNQLSDLVKKIALKDKIDESRELAADVDTSLYSGLKKGNEGLRDRGVKKAPFVVLIGANMPSILAEISFVTNPDDAQELERPAYRERVAESLYNGVARYAGAINGAPSLAKKAPRTERASLKQAAATKD